jgi:hypothetical protein
VARFVNVVTVGLREGCGIWDSIDPIKDFECLCSGGNDIRARLYPLGQHTVCLRPEVTMSSQIIVFSILMKAMINANEKSGPCIQTV